MDHPTEAGPRRPRPTINTDVVAFWEGVQHHKLLIQRCCSCQKVRFPFQPLCGHCHSDEWDVVESKGRGIIFSFTRVHHPPSPPFATPYVVGLVALDEGVRIVSLLKDEPREGFQIGDRVGVSYTVDADYIFPDFSPQHAEPTE